MLILHKFLCDGSSAQAQAIALLLKRVKILFSKYIQMNPKQLEDSILEAVSDAIARVWTIEEKELIQNDSELQNQLYQWLNNSLSNTCWHPDNYKIIQNLSAPSNFSLSMSLLEDEETHLPF
ncbi:MAG: hypothetical protein V7K41_19115 [Nostoc sp.]|uniref:hypothetical protein n=1 Tax=Nostoc sp. TaxID=1180 RepID=UPI002FF5DEE7